MNLTEADMMGIIRQYIALVRAAGISVQEVRLFGSRAKGKPRHPYSDIDLCIISPDFGKDHLGEMDTLFMLTAQLDSPVPIEPIPFAPGDLENRYSTLASEVLTHGKIIKT